MCIKYGPCKDLLYRLKNLEDTDVHPFQGIPKDKVSLEDVPRQTVDPDYSDEDINIKIDYTAASTVVFYK